MKTSRLLIFSTSPQTQPMKKFHNVMSLAIRRRHLYGKPRRNNTGKESDSETGLYYFGARYLDPKTGRWISGDPAVGEYIPSAPVNEEARKRNGNLPGMGGVFNYVNLHVYHYAGNNPVKYVDPDGEDFFNFTNNNITVIPESYNDNAVIVRPGEMYMGAIDGVILIDNTIVKITGGDGNPISLYMENIDGEDKAFLIGKASITLNNIGDFIKFIKGIFPNKRELLSGVYSPEAALRHSEFDMWRRKAENAETDSPRVREMTTYDIAHVDRLKQHKQQLTERE